MKKLLLLALLTFCCAAPAQVVGPGFVNYVTSAPSGTCSQGVPAQIILGSGDIYTCQSGTWGKAGGSGGGTVTSVGLTVNGGSFSGSLAVTGSPITGTGTFDLAFTGTNGDVMVFGASNAPTDSGKLLTTINTLRCYPGLGDGLNAIAAGTYLQTNCYNNSGVTWTITRIGCFTDNSGTSALSATNGAGTALLTGAVTCTTAAGGAAGTQSATVTIANGDVIKFSFVADGTSKQSGWFISLTQ